MLKVKGKKDGEGKMTDTSVEANHVILTIMKLLWV